jgi:hypothetical protein
VVAAMIVVRAAMAVVAAVAVAVSVKVARHARLAKVAIVARAQWVRAVDLVRRDRWARVEPRVQWVRVDLARRVPKAVRHVAHVLRATHRCAHPLGR